MTCHEDCAFAVNWTPKRFDEQGQELVRFGHCLVLGIQVVALGAGVCPLWQFGPSDVLVEPKKGD